MHLRSLPSLLWTRCHGLLDEDGKAKPETVEILIALESAIARIQTSRRESLLHYAVEAYRNPERAIQSADGCETVFQRWAPGPHARAHLHAWGRYHDATIANERAIDSDRTTQAVSRQGLYPFVTPAQPPLPLGFGYDGGAQREGNRGRPLHGITYRHEAPARAGIWNDSALPRHTALRAGSIRQMGRDSPRACAGQ